MATIFRDKSLLSFIVFEAPDSPKSKQTKTINEK
jgi:hypothetical protein